MGTARNVFVTGGTGYLGHPLIEHLLKRGHRVRALVRAGSEGKLPDGCEVVHGDALNAPSFASAVPPSDTFVQLVGTPHPNPRKAAEFRRVDLASGLAAVAASVEADVGHLVYVSVAHPAPMMKAYIDARVQCEKAILASQLNATILRPWYVLGPGHRWPYALVPAYWLLEKVPATRDGARRLGLVNREQMVSALVRAVEEPPAGISVVEAPAIRNGLSAAQVRAASA